MEERVEFFLCVVLDNYRITNLDWGAENGLPKDTVVAVKCGRSSKEPHPALLLYPNDFSARSRTLRKSSTLELLLYYLVCTRYFPPARLTCVVYPSRFLGGRKPGWLTFSRVEYSVECLWSSKGSAT